MNGEKPLKESELRLISELMKNCRRSDRELAKALGVSQPTISRTMKKLEKRGIIKEYTIIPDFAKIGYKIMGITSINVSELIEQERIRPATSELEKRSPHASLMAVGGIGKGKNRVFITLYKDYSAYSEAARLTKTLPFADVDSLDSFLVDLTDKANYRVLSMAPTAKHLLKDSKKKQEEKERERKNSNT